MQAFATHSSHGKQPRVVKILDWRALRPGENRFAFPITKAALAVITRSAALALAPAFNANALALGVVLPPADSATRPRSLDPVPAPHGGELGDVAKARLLLPLGPAYVAGEINHVGGGRHPVQEAMWTE